MGEKLLDNISFKMLKFDPLSLGGNIFRSILISIYILKHGASFWT